MSVFPKAKFSIVDFSTRYSSEESCRELILPAPLSARVCLPALRRDPARHGQNTRPISLQILPQADLCDQRHRFSRDTYQAQSVALGDVSVHGRQARLLGGPADDKASRDLQDCVVHLAPPALRNEAPQPTAKSAGAGQKKRKSWWPFQSQRKAIRDTQKWR